MYTAPLIRTGLARVIVAMGLLLASVVPVSAAESGGLMGSVDVQPGADVLVLVRNLETGAMATAQPAQDGNYRLERLAAGKYEVTLVVDGKSVAREVVQVNAGFSATVPELYPGG